MSPELPTARMACGLALVDVGRCFLGRGEAHGPLALQVDGTLRTGFHHRRSRAASPGQPARRCHYHPDRSVAFQVDAGAGSAPRRTESLVASEPETKSHLGILIRRGDQLVDLRSVAFSMPGRARASTLPSPQLVHLRSAWTYALNMRSCFMSSFTMPSAAPSQSVRSAWNFPRKP